MRELPKTTTELIEFLKEHEHGGVTGKSRELVFWLRDKKGKEHRLVLTNDFSYGDGICTDIGITFDSKTV